MHNDDYKRMLLNMTVNRHGDKIAPHKPVLLLAVIDMIEKGEISTPFIPLTDELERRFRKLWKIYVRSFHYSCRLEQPFFHLSTSPFWKLEKLPGYVERKDYSKKRLKESFAGAWMQEELFELLKREDFREEVKHLLIATYLPYKPLMGMDVAPIILLGLTIAMGA